MKPISSRLIPLNTLFIAILLLAGYTSPGRAGIPVTGTNEDSSAAGTSSSILPRLSVFTEQVKNNNSTQVTGIYVSNHFAFPVVQQPAGEYGYVSTQPDTLTQFSSAASFGSSGFLAHDYLAGESFFGLGMADIINLVYGDGHRDVYRVMQVRRYQALSPKSAYSDFVDLDSGETLTATDLFYATYAVPGQVVFQTCISQDGVDSWGRLFIVAKPYQAQTLGFSRLEYLKN